MPTKKEILAARFNSLVDSSYTKRLSLIKDFWVNISDWSSDKCSSRPRCSHIAGLTSRAVRRTVIADSSNVAYSWWAHWYVRNEVDRTEVEESTALFEAWRSWKVLLNSLGSAMVIFSLTSLSASGSSLNVTTNPLARLKFKTVKTGLQNLLLPVLWRNLSNLLKSRHFRKAARKMIEWKDSIGLFVKFETPVTI